jgi:hypothetical protein
LGLVSGWRGGLSVSEIILMQSFVGRGSQSMNWMTIP